MLRVLDSRLIFASTAMAVVSVLWWCRAQRSASPALALRLATAVVDGGRVDEITEIINVAYRVAEEGVLASDRMIPAETRRLISAGQLMLAELGGELVGTVQVKFMDVDFSKKAEFGLLSVKEGCRKQGLGGQIIGQVEALCKVRGCAALILDLLYRQVYTVVQPLVAPT
jgi:GNAT superfamily N-acetyltransferase